MHIYLLTSDGDDTNPRANKPYMSLDTFRVTRMVDQSSPSRIDTKVEIADACVVSCALRKQLSSTLDMLSPVSSRCCIIVNAVYSNVLRLFLLRDSWRKWDHVVLVGEVRENTTNVYVYHVGKAPRRDYANRLLRNLYPKQLLCECDDILDHFLFPIGPSLISLFPPVGVGGMLKELDVMRVAVRHRATLCRKSNATRDSSSMYGYLRMLLMYYQMRLRHESPHPPVLWDIVLFLYYVCRTFSLPCNNMSNHVHHSTLEGLGCMLSDRPYILRVDAFCECIHWAHSNRAVDIRSVIPMACARSIDMRMHWVYAVQPFRSVERMQKAMFRPGVMTIERQREWYDMPVPVAFVAYDDMGECTIRALFPATKKVHRRSSIYDALAFIWKTQSRGVVVVCGSNVIDDIQVAMYHKSLDASTSISRSTSPYYAPMDGVFLQIGAI